MPIQRAGPRRRCAFTLIELLVVIAVVSLLMSILLPALSAARKAASDAQCLSGLRSIGQSVVMYYSDFDSHFPLSSHTTGSLARKTSWLNSLQEYGVPPAFRKCPLDPYKDQRLTSYATNEHFEPLTPGVDYDPVTRTPLPGGRTRSYERVALVPRPCVTIYLYEPEGDGTVDHLNTHQFQNAEDLRTQVAVTRHQGAGNFLFVDGHATSWPWSDLSGSFSPATSPFDPATAR